MRNFIYSILFCCLISVSGCGESNSNQPKVSEVKGVIKLNGAPLPFAEIRMMPVGNSGSISETTSDKDGNFEMIYSTGLKGAIPGNHNVKVTVYEKRGPEVVKGQPGLPLTPPIEIDLGVITVNQEPNQINLEVPANKKINLKNIKVTL